MLTPEEKKQLADKVLFDFLPEGQTFEDKFNRYTVDKDLDANNWTLRDKTLSYYVRFPITRDYFQRDSLYVCTVQPFGFSTKEFSIIISDGNISNKLNELANALYDKKLQNAARDHALKVFNAIFNKK